MACLEMYNNSSPSPSSHSQSPSPPLLPPPPPPMSPRISFSNDFVESHHHHHHHHQTHNSHHLLKTARSSEPPPSSDFEFNVTNGNILSSASADELFFKGKLLPFKDTHNNNNNSQMQRTLRDELLVDDEADLPFSLKPPKGSSSSSSSSSSNRWKGFLGLRKSHIGSKKPEKLDPSFDSGKRFSFPLEDPNLTKSPQEMVSSEGPSSSDMEMGI